MEELRILSRIKNYAVKFQFNLDFLRQLTKQKEAYFIIDKNVYSLYKEYFENIPEEKNFLFEAIEENKTLESVFKIYQFLLNSGVRRNSILISVGGGITQDVSGFVASSLYRGIYWIYIPTTLLAQADSCIGSKTSLNFQSSKNVLGTFYPPDEIYIAADFLKTLKEIDIFTGFGEIVRLQLIKARNKEDLEKIALDIKKAYQDKNILLSLVKDSLAVKKEYIEEDEIDKGKRNILNYGHTLGHALESASDFIIPHGVCVVAGMIYADLLANGRGLLDRELFQIILDNILLPNLHLDKISLRKEFLETAALIEGLKKDKKRTGEKFTFIIHQSDFSFKKIQDVGIEEFEKNLNELKQLLF